MSGIKRKNLEIGAKKFERESHVLEREIRSLNHRISKSESDQRIAKTNFDKICKRIKNESIKNPCLAHSNVDFLKRKMTKHLEELMISKRRIQDLNSDLKKTVSNYNKNEDCQKLIKSRIEDLIFESKFIAEQNGEEELVGLRSVSREAERESEFLEQELCSSGDSATSEFEVRLPVTVGLLAQTVSSENTVLVEGKRLLAQANYDRQLTQLNSQRPEISKFSCSFSNENGSQIGIEIDQGDPTSMEIVFRVEDQREFDLLNAHTDEFVSLLSKRGFAGSRIEILKEV